MLPLHRILGGKLYLKSFPLKNLFLEFDGGGVRVSTLLYWVCTLLQLLAITTLLQLLAITTVLQQLAITYYYIFYCKQLPIKLL